MDPKLSYTQEYPDILYATRIVTISTSNKDTGHAVKEPINPYGVSVTDTFSGYDVELRENEAESYAMSFDNLRLGEIDMSIKGFSLLPERFKCSVWNENEYRMSCSARDLNSGGTDFPHGLRLYIPQIISVFPGFSDSPVVQS